MPAGTDNRQATRVRYGIIALIFAVTFINFLDRMTVSVLGPVITEQLRLSNLQFATISTSFLVAYTASQGLSGRLYDRVGARLGFTMSVTLWALAAMGHAFARGLASLSALRFILGLGEAGNWPGAAKVIAEWFPPARRAFAMGIFNSGVSIASIAAPPLIVWIQQRYGWRATFLATGALGFIWLPLWLRFYSPPAAHPRANAAELAVIREGRDEDDRPPPSWAALLRRRQVWAIVLARFLTDPVWWLFITWLPLYLATQRGFSLREIGLYAWLPFVAADAGSLLGGWLSGHLISRGWTADRARKTVIVAAVILMGAGIPAARADTAMQALGFISIVMFAFQVWINNVQTMPSDWFPARAVASVAGLGGTGAGIGAILFTLTTGAVVDRLHSYNPILVTAALLPTLGTAVLFLAGGPIRRVPLDE